MTGRTETSSKIFTLNLKIKSLYCPTTYQHQLLHKHDHIIKDVRSVHQPSHTQLPIPPLPPPPTRLTPLGGNPAPASPATKSLPTVPPLSSPTLSTCNKLSSLPIFVHLARLLTFSFPYSLLEQFHPLFRPTISMLPFSHQHLLPFSCLPSSPSPPRNSLHSRAGSAPGAAGSTPRVPRFGAVAAAELT